MPNKKTIAAAEAFLKEGSEAWVNGGIAYGRWFADDCLEGFGGQSRGAITSSGAGCHGFMKAGVVKASYSTYKGDFKGLVFANVISDTRRKTGGHSFKKDVFEAYTRFIIQESPFSKAILNRDNLDQCRNQGVIIDTEHYGTAVTILICKLLRVFIEDTYRAGVWYDLTMKGVHPMLALVVSQCVDQNLNVMGRSHGATILPPANEKEIPKIFVEEIPEAKKMDTGWEGTSVLGLTGVASYDYSKTTYVYTYHGPLPVKQAGLKKEKVPDGWGGYIEKVVGTTIDTLAADLIKFQKPYVK